MTSRPVPWVSDLLRLAGSLKLGTVQAAGLIRTLQTKDRPTKLARVVFHGKGGELRQRYREGQEDQLGSLGLVVNVIVLWNRIYMDVALNWLRHYVAPTLLVIDEVGYLSYSNRHADLMFELISRRYEQKSTVVTTNRAFADWREIFPNAACVVSMVDRLMHNAEVVSIEGDSYRAKEAKERAERKGKQRRGGKS